MSGVRVKDDELRRLGMTLPGFIERGRVIASLPSLGLLTLAAHTPEHWEVEYREIDEITGDPAMQIAREGFDIVAISALTARILDAYAVAGRLRECGVPVILGGLHASALPQEALVHADVVVQGEGELVWPGVLSDFEAGQLRRFYSSLHAPRRFALADARVPRYDLLDVDRYNRLTLQTTRGCPLDCSFCAALRLISPYKMKPFDRIRAELEAILEIWPRPFLELADDNTFVSKPWARGLARLLAEYSVRWFTETDLSVADDEELLEALAESGCAQLLIGLESVDRAALDQVDSRHWKQQQRGEYVAKIQKIQSHGITVNGCFIFGFDQDDPGVFDRTKEFIHESGLSEVQITILTPFPGTQLYERLKSQGRLLRPVFWDACTLFDVTFQPKRMNVSELEDRFRRLMLELYNPEESARRKAIRKDCYSRVAAARHAACVSGVSASGGCHYVKPNISSRIPDRDEGVGLPRYSRRTRWSRPSTPGFWPSQHVDRRNGTVLGRP
jgi:radical SAM superfamily enzyme YgiQ (UPF0313 family)